VRQLGGIEIPGPAWERDVLPARIVDYDPADLEHLCLAGEVGWGRFAVALEPEAEDDPAATPRRRGAPTRSAPLAFFLREELSLLLEPLPPGGEPRERLSPVALEVLGHLERRGASFSADVSRTIRRLPTEVEDALWELVSAGLVTGDGVAGLRTLLLPDEKRRPRPARRSLELVRGRARPRSMPVGRWSLLRGDGEADGAEVDAADVAARRLLRRWGVLFRELCARERRLPPWREILFALRRMEARAEVRGGRFVNGLVGEQFALPEAVESLRAARRRRAPDEIVLVAAADPLNLVGILTPGPRVSPASGFVIAFRDGVPVETGELGAVTSRLRALEIARPPR
jgi:ATP-dependent helicase Lhr and Lhr-like helicase